MVFKIFLVLLMLGGTLASTIGSRASSSSDLTTTTTTTVTRHSFVAVVSGAIVSVPSWNSSFHGSFKLGAENKTSVTFAHVSGSASSSDFAYNVASLAGSVAEGLSTLSAHSVLTESKPAVDVTVTYFPIRYPGTSSVVSPALTTTSVNQITATVTNTSLYTRTINVIQSPTHQVVEQDLDDEDCMLSTVFVTVTGHVTVSVSVSSSTSHATALLVSGSTSGIALSASQASDAAVTGIAASTASPPQQSALNETHSAPAIPAISSASTVPSSSIRANPSPSPGQTNNTISAVARPSTSPFLTPNHPDFNMTVAGAGRGVKAHSGVTLSLILAFIGGMVLFSN